MTQTHVNNGQQTPTTINDITEMTIIAVYLVQKLGQPTLKELQAKALEKLNCKMDGRTLERALKGAAKRNIIAKEGKRMPSEQGGAVVDVFSMKNLSWRAPPEYAHITDLLPKLTSTPEAQVIKDRLDKGETEARGSEETKSRGNDIDDYRHFEVLIFTTDELLGSQIHCPYTDQARGITSSIKRDKDDKDDKPEMESIFVMDPVTKHRLITSDVLQGWFITNAGRYGGMQEARGQYVAFKPVHIKAQPIQLVLPVNNSKQGAAAPKSYEAIPPGQILLIEFTAPTKGLFSSEQFEKLFHVAGDRPRRGLSPARGKRYGHFRVIGFRDGGALKTGGIDFILNDLPDEVLRKFGKKKLEIPEQISDEHYKYMMDATDRLRDVVIKAGAKVKTPEAETPSNPEDES